MIDDEDRADALFHDLSDRTSFANQLVDERYRVVETRSFDGRHVTLLTAR